MENPKGAGGQRPKYVVILLDVSEEMAQTLGDRQRIAMVSSALSQLPRLTGVRDGVQPDDERSQTKMALIAYSNKPFLALDFTWVHQVGGPQIIKPGGKANAFEAFRSALDLLESTISFWRDGPPPVLCHISAGRYGSGGSPAGIAKRIRALGAAGGPVLLMEAFLRSTTKRTPDQGIARWPGISTIDEINQLYEEPSDVQYARELFEMSSLVPEDYLPFVRRAAGARCLRHDARLLFPVTDLETLTLALSIAVFSGHGIEIEEEEFASARLVCLNGPRQGYATLLPASGLFTVGRSPGHSLVIRDPSVSRDHALIEVADGRCVVHDWPWRPSTRGVVVRRANNKSAVRRHELAHGDHVIFGDTVFSFEGLAICENDTIPHIKVARHAASSISQ